MPQAVQAALYLPGETLNPNCSPTDSVLTCGISTVVASSTANSIPYYSSNGSVLSATSTMTILSNGNIGIGTATPAYKLDVIGDISLNKVNIFQTHQVYAIGDSLSNNSYESTLTGLLGTSWNVNSKGVGGNTTAQMVARFSGDVVVNDAEYVVIFGGINDIFANVSATTIEANLQTMYTAAHNNGSKVVAVTITPFKTHASWTAGFQTVLDDVNTWILNTATNVDYKIDAYSTLEDPANPDTLLPAYSDADHLHLNSAGYTVLAGLISTGTTWTANTTIRNLTVSGSNVSLSQSLRTTDSPQFSGLVINGLSSSINLAATSVVGLGTLTPQRTLDVRGSDLVLSSNDQYAGNVLVMSTDSSEPLNKGGSIGFGGTYGGASASWTFGSIKGAKENSTDGNADGYLSFWTSGPSANTYERMRLNSSGYLGIKVTNPSSFLDINPAMSTSSLSFVTGITLRNHLVTLTGSDPTTYSSIYGVKLGDLQLYSLTANQTVTQAASLITAWPWKSTNVTATNVYSILVPTRAGVGALNAYGIQVNASTGATNNYAAAFLGGNVGIGTTSPYALLSVSNSKTTAVGTPLFSIASTTNGTATTTVFSVASTGDVTINGSSGSTCTIGNGTGGTSCTSDERLKTNIALIVNPLESIQQIRGVTFNWADSAKDQSQFIGVIAQDVQKVFPQAVSTLENGYLAVDYSALVAPLIESVKELAGQVSSLATTVAGFAQSFSTNQLCIGSTCIDEAQLKTLLDQEGVQPVQQAVQEDIPEDETVIDEPTDTPADTSPDIISSDDSTVTETVIDDLVGDADVDADTETDVNVGTSTQ